MFCINIDSCLPSLLAVSFHFLDPIPFLMPSPSQRTRSYTHYSIVLCSLVLHVMISPFAPIPVCSYCCLLLVHLISFCSVSLVSVSPRASQVKLHIVSSLQLLVLVPFFHAYLPLTALHIFVLGFNPVFLSSFLYECFLKGQ